MCFFNEASEPSVAEASLPIDDAMVLIVRSSCNIYPAYQNITYHCHGFGKIGKN